MIPRRLVLLLLAIAVASILVPAAGATSGQQEEQIRVVLARAETLMRAGDSAGALAAIDRFLERYDRGGAASTDATGALLHELWVTRVRTAWAAGLRSGLDDALDRMIELDPAYELRGADVNSDLSDRFRRRRERLVGYLRVATLPQDATVLLNGRELADRPEIIPVLEGDHVVEAVRAGYAPGRAEVSVEANRTEGVGLTLERASVTIRVATEPAGATVYLDGQLVGVTDPAPGGTTSWPVTVDGLLPGFHDLEVRLLNHRPFEQRVELPDLRDYDLGVVRMVRSLGYVVLRGVPPDATLRVDGEEVVGERQRGVNGNEMARFELPVGTHEFAVEFGAAGLFVEAVEVDDGATRTIDVDLRPGVALLGARGGDDLDRDEVLAGVADGIQRIGTWHLVDRRLDGVRLLGDGYGTPTRSARERVAERLTASVYLLLEIPSDAPGSVDVHTWAANGDLPASRTRLRRGDDAALSAWLDAFAAPISAGRPWLGAIVADDMREGGAVVMAVSAGAPAASADLRAGDRILAIDRREVRGAADVAAVVGARAPFSGLVLQVERAGERQATRVTLGVSPMVERELEGERAIAAWARAAAEIVRPTATVPPWVLQLQQAHLLIQVQRYDAAVRLLGTVQAPEGAPFGQGAVDYWTGVALLAEGRDLNSARIYLQRAAREADARLFHNDGPRLGPRARGRLAALEASR